MFDYDYMEALRHYLTMFFIATLVLILVLVGFAVVKAEETWTAYSNEQIVEAIRQTENSEKYPYGIKSIDTKGDKEYAKQICLNSVRNGRKRWIAAGKPYDLIIFIGLRYCPPKAHKLNSNWVRLVKYFLRKEY